MSRIFISYRRSVSRETVAGLYAACVSQFGRAYVFRDTDAIRPGDRFPDRIRNALAECEVFLPLIGPGWYDTADKNGLRLHQPEDWVRNEIATVLGRNAAAVAAGGPPPVLVVPLLEADGLAPTADRLPADLHPFSDHNATDYRKPDDLALIAPAIEEHLGSPPMGEFGPRVLMQQPDWSRRDDYRFRFVRRPADLDPFVELSDDEVVIAAANPGLAGADRRTLYDNWCQWTADEQRWSWHDERNRVRAFLALDQRQADGMWLTVAVSILLPLTVYGGQHLRLMRQGQGSPAAKRNAVTLKPGDVARGRSSRLLLDTWVVRRRPHPSGRPARVDHHFWAGGLIQRHVAEFWSPNAGEPVTFYCEPVNPQIARMLHDLRFLEENRNAASGNLFVLKYPLDEDLYSPEDQVMVQRVLGTIQAVGLLPVAG